MWLLISSAIVAVSSLTLALELQKYVGIRGALPSLKILPDVIHTWCHPVFARQSKSFQDALCHLLDVWIYAVAAITTLVASRYAILPLEDFFAHSFYLISIVALVRCLSFNMTILPQCDFRPKKAAQGNSFKELLNLVLLKNTQFGYTNDLLFSGHTAFSFLSSLMIQRYTSLAEPFKWMLWSSTFLLSLGLVCSKKHYSIDIFFAWITTCFIFQNYTAIFIQ